MVNSQKHIEVSAKIVFRHKGRFLYHRTKDGARDVPGGHIEFGETIFEALKRELKEELGFILKKEPKLMYAWTYFPRDKSAHRVYLVYLLDIPKMLAFKHQELDDLEFIWLKKDEIKAQKFLPEMERYLLKAVDF